MSLTAEQANAIVAYAKQHGVSDAEAAKALGVELGFNPEIGKTDPWAKFVKQDTRIDLERLADYFQREDGVSEVEALKRAIQMNNSDPASAAPLVHAEADRFRARAEEAARAEWVNTPDGIAALGRMRQAQANALKERADSMRPELAARGLPVDGMSDNEVVGWVNDMAAQRAADAEANSLQANLDHIAQLEAAKGGEGQ